MLAEPELSSCQPLHPVIARIGFRETRPTGGVRLLISRIMMFVTRWMAVIYRTLDNNHPSDSQNFPAPTLPISFTRVGRIHQIPMDLRFSRSEEPKYYTVCVA